MSNKTTNSKGKKKIVAWIGFSDGKPYLSYNKEYDKQEYFVYKTKWRAKKDFKDVRPCIIIIPR